MQNNVTEELKLNIFNHMTAQAKADGVDIRSLNKTAVAKQFSVSPRTVGRILDKYLVDGTEEVKSKPETISVKAVQMTASAESDIRVINWTITQASVLLTLSDGNNASITRDNQNYKKVTEMLMAGNNDVMELVNPAKNFAYKYGNVVVDGDTVKFDGHAVDKKIAFFVIDAVKKGDVATAERLTKFLNNLLLNPSFRATRELYNFLKATDIEIADDGCFYAWKKVRSTYMDIHSNTMFNGVGEKLSVPRNKVDENSETCCSYGLHVCSKSYLPYFGSNSSTDRILKVKVNPADVVAIPSSYNNAKMRCCGYEVLEDVTGKI